MSIILLEAKRQGSLETIRLPNTPARLRGMCKANRDPPRLPGCAKCAKRTRDPPPALTRGMCKTNPRPARPARLRGMCKTNPRPSRLSGCAKCAKRTRDPPWLSGCAECAKRTRGPPRLPGCAKCAKRTRDPPRLPGCAKCAKRTRDPPRLPGCAKCAKRTRAESGALPTWIAILLHILRLNCSRGQEFFRAYEDAGGWLRGLDGDRCESWKKPMEGCDCNPVIVAQIRLRPVFHKNGAIVWRFGRSPLKA